MVNSISSVTLGSSDAVEQKNLNKLTSKEDKKTGKTDYVEFGKSKSVSNADAMNMVVERALDKLRSVVSDARAQLGLADDAVVDTSPDATAGRIADFALGFWSKYAEQHGLEDTEEGRKQYADFIGSAIGKGIEEARGILTALSALNPEIDDNINKTADVINTRLQDFVKNGLGNN